MANQTQKALGLSARCTFPSVAFTLKRVDPSSTKSNTLDIEPSLVMVFAPSCIRPFDSRFGALSRSNRSLLYEVWCFLLRQCFFLEGFGIWPTLPIGGVSSVGMSLIGLASFDLLMLSEGILATLLASTSLFGFVFL